MDTYSLLEKAALDIMAVDNNAYFTVAWQFPSSTENGKFPCVVSLVRSMVRKEWMSEQILLISENKAGKKYIVYPMLKIAGEHLVHHRDSEIWQKGYLCKTKLTFTVTVRSWSNIRKS